MDVFKLSSTVVSSASLEQPCRKMVVIPLLLLSFGVRLSSIADLGFHREVLGGFIFSRDEGYPVYLGSISIWHSFSYPPSFLFPLP